MDQYTVISLLARDVWDCDIRFLARKVIVSLDQIWIIIKQLATELIKYWVCSKTVFLCIVFVLSLYCLCIVLISCNKSSYKLIRAFRVIDLLVLITANNFEFDILGLLVSAMYQTSCLLILCIFSNVHHNNIIQTDLETC